MFSFHFQYFLFFISELWLFFLFHNIPSFWGSFRIFSLPLVFWNFTKVFFFYHLLCWALHGPFVAWHFCTPLSLLYSFTDFHLFIFCPTIWGIFFTLYFNTSRSHSYFSSKCSPFFPHIVVVLGREQASVFSLRILLNYRFLKVSPVPWCISQGPSRRQMCLNSKILTEESLMERLFIGGWAGKREPKRFWCWLRSYHGPKKEGEYYQNLEELGAVRLRIKATAKAMVRYKEWSISSFWWGRVAKLGRTGWRMGTECSFAFN